jgi:hypothetical protein
MKPQPNEALTKAAQCADLLMSDIREAHKLTDKDRALEILLRDLLLDATKIKNRLTELEAGSH